MNLKYTSKFFYEFTKLYFEQILDKCDKTHDAAMKHYGLTTQQKLNLTYEKGCQKCKKCHKFCNKIHWPLPIRVCKPCFNKITICSLTLAKYEIKYNKKLLLYFIIEQHNYFVKKYIYLIKDIETMTKKNISLHMQEHSTRQYNKQYEDMKRSLAVSFRTYT